MALLSADQVDAALAPLDGWAREGDQVSRQFSFADFPAAVAFTVRLAFEAEAANHHPDIDIRYNKVGITLSTHSEGGVTDKDIDLARAIDALARQA